MYSNFSLSDFDGININDCLTADAYYLKKIRSPDGLKKRLELAYKNLVRATFELEKLTEETACDFLCFRGLERDDYRHFFYQVVEQIKVGSAIKVENYKKANKKINLAVSDFITNNRHLLSLIDEKNILRKLCLFLNFCSYLIVLDAIRKVDFKVLLVFADMQPIDNLLVQYFRNKGKKTITLQHGLYVEYENYDTVNKVNYEQQCAEYFLAWGECTGKLIKDYHPETRVVICGKPELSMAELPQKLHPDDNEFILVIFDQNIFDTSNYEMIKIATEYAETNSLEVKVKFHPQNNRKKYKADFPNMKESGDLMGSKLIIGHTSSLLFEAMVLGHKVVRYKTEIPCVFMPEEFEFSEIEELENIASKNLPNTNPDLSKFYIASTGAASLSKYERFFNKLLREPLKNDIFS